MEDIVIVPTYNERESIKGILEEVFRVVPHVRVFVVDDNSPDKTAEIVRKLQDKFPQLYLHLRREKRGLGSAYIEMFTKLAGDLSIRTITTMDADGSHNPVYLEEMLRESEDHDVVIGSRYVKEGGTKGWDARRRVLSWGGNLYARTVSGVPVYDLTAGFVTFRGEILRRMPLGRISSSGYAYTIESKCHAWHLGARIKEIPIIFEERRAGASKLSGHIIREGIIAPWRVRLSRILS